MISFPVSYDSIDIPDGAMVRSGGTDLQGRLRASIETPVIVDLTRIDGYAGIIVDDSGTRIGGGTSMSVVAQELRDRYPALAMTTGGLATPLTQRTRCWYYRHPGLDCFKSGGDSCPARDGRQLYGVAFDRSDCVHPHPSSIAMALLCHDDAVVELASGTEISVEELLGDGVDPTKDHTLGPGEVIRALRLAEPWPDERGAYFRSISRFEAEWPLVECVARASFDGAAVTKVALALGGVATVPMRMRGAEAHLVGSELSDDVISACAAACADGANPLPETGYKVELMVATVTETLERLRAAAVTG